MTSKRSGSLKKMERLYGLLEAMHATALQQATALVREAELAIAVQGAVMREARTDAHVAIVAGDREQYAVAEVQRVTSGQRQERIEALRLVRETLAEEARAVYDESRIQRGQIKAVVDRAAAAERLLEARQAQAASDDRFLSRMRWNQLRDETA